MSFVVPYPGLVRMTVEGRASGPMSQRIVQLLEGALARHGQLAVFDDWENATGYESEVRIRLTDWTERHQQRIPETHVLAGSKLVSMGLAVAAIVLRKPLQVHPTRASFERAWASAVASRR
ncbi:MAG: hypothetical protein IPJ34_26790 [Myxococcales bacterium]|nr:hypothetical protein [Myxococcales bacterium]